LQQYVADGRSTPGPRQKNDTTIEIWKERPPNAETLRKIGD
jgi:hypothetical protein